MATHSNILAWEIPWMEEPGGLQSMESQKSPAAPAARPGPLEGAELLTLGPLHGNPLQCSCLENPRDGGAWWAAIYGVAQSQT